jgi:hypothetical protein
LQRRAETAVFTVFWKKDGLAGQQHFFAFRSSFIRIKNATIFNDYLILLYFFILIGLLPCALEC